MLELLAAILDVAGDGCDSYSNNTYDECEDDVSYANTDAWRGLHPYDYSPFTGGSNSSEDESNGW